MGGNQEVFKISFCGYIRLKHTQNLKSEDRRLQSCLVLKTDDLASKPTKPVCQKIEDLNS